MVDGDPGNPVTLTGTSAQPGWWRGVYLDPNSDDTSVIDNAVIEYGGYSWDANIYMQNASPTISNCIIRNGQDYGIRLEGDSGPALHQ